MALSCKAGTTPHSVGVALRRDGSVERVHDRDRFGQVSAAVFDPGNGLLPSPRFISPLSSGPAESDCVNTPRAALRHVDQLTGPVFARMGARDDDHDDVTHCRRSGVPPRVLADADGGDTIEPPRSPISRRVPPGRSATARQRDDGSVWSSMQIQLPNRKNWKRGSRSPTRSSSISRSSTTGNADTPHSAAAPQSCGEIAVPPVVSAVVTIDAAARPSSTLLRREREDHWLGVEFSRKAIVACRRMPCMSLGRFASARSRFCSAVYTTPEMSGRVGRL